MSKSPSTERIVDLEAARQSVQTYLEEIDAGEVQTFEAYKRLTQRDDVELTQALGNLIYGNRTVTHQDDTEESRTEIRVKQGGNGFYANAYQQYGKSGYGIIDLTSRRRVFRVGAVQRRSALFFDDSSDDTWFRSIAIARYPLAKPMDMYQPAEARTPRDRIESLRGFLTISQPLVRRLLEVTAC